MRGLPSRATAAHAVDHNHTLWPMTGWRRLLHPQRNRLRRRGLTDLSGPIKAAATNDSNAQFMKFRSLREPPFTPTRSSQHRVGPDYRHRVRRLVWQSADPPVMICNPQETGTPFRIASSSQGIKNVSVRQRRRQWVPSFRYLRTMVDRTWHRGFASAGWTARPATACSDRVDTSRARVSVTDASTRFDISDGMSVPELRVVRHRSQHQGLFAAPRQRQPFVPNPIRLGLARHITALGQFQFVHVALADAVIPARGHPRDIATGRSSSQALFRARRQRTLDRMLTSRQLPAFDGTLWTLPMQRTPAGRDADRYQF